MLNPGGRMTSFKGSCPTRDGAGALAEGDCVFTKRAKLILNSKHAIKFPETCILSRWYRQPCTLV